ncbi:MAG: hypothetical protein H0T85_09290 [Geodermatophilaceae bacterium]|nr:hypothetical protein [Geodermatophilaceae bacterium]
MTTSPEVDEADLAVFQRLSRLAFDEAGRSTPSAVVDMALRNSNRRRRARAGLTLVAGLGAVALVLPQVSDAIWSTSPARPGLTTPVEGASAEPPVIAPAGVGATFGELTLRVDFDVQVASSEPVPGRESASSSTIPTYWAVAADRSRRWPDSLLRAAAAGW